MKLSQIAVKLSSTGGKSSGTGAGTGGTSTASTNASGTSTSTGARGTSGTPSRATSSSAANGASNRAATGQSGGAGQSSGQSTASGGQSSTQSSGQNAAARVITDTAAIATAQTALNDAQRNLTAAVLEAPISGTIASVGLVAGTTASSGNTITIVGTGPVKVTVNVPLATIRKVKVGQVAHVTADGSTTSRDGTVTAIGLLPTISSNGTTSYAVTVLVPNPTAALSTGARAQVSIVIGTVSNVLGVPNSALTTTGAGTAFVTLVKGGKATSRTSVRTGIVGALSTQIISGLKADDEVLLADRSQSLPANSSTVTGRVTGGGGGAGAGAAGFVRPGG
jgi:multidrug efflux pump subunit AcrA (membrane-fusion protein)